MTVSGCHYAARCRLVIEYRYRPLTILSGELLATISAWRERMSPIEVIILSDLLTGDAGDSVVEHTLDCLFRDDDPLAEAEGRQPAGASHFISEGAADA